MEMTSRLGIFIGSASRPATAQAAARHRHGQERSTDRSQSRARVEPRSEIAELAHSHSHRVGRAAHNRRARARASKPHRDLAPRFTRPTHRAERRARDANARGRRRAPGRLPAFRHVSGEGTSCAFLRVCNPPPRGAPSSSSARDVVPARPRDRVDVVRAPSRARARRPRAIPRRAAAAESRVASPRRLRRGIFPGRARRVDVDVVAVARREDER
jgi:hypothetical protein